MIPPNVVLCGIVRGSCDMSSLIARPADLIAKKISAVYSRSSLVPNGTVIIPRRNV